MIADQMIGQLRLSPAKAGMTMERKSLLKEVRVPL